MREQALAWWRGLTHIEAYEYYRLWYCNTDNKSKCEFSSFCASSSKIELVYRYYILEEDVKF